LPAFRSLDQLNISPPHLFVSKKDSAAPATLNTPRSRNLTSPHLNCADRHILVHGRWAGRSNRGFASPGAFIQLRCPRLGPTDTATFRPRNQFTAVGCQTDGTPNGALLLQRCFLLAMPWLCQHPRRGESWPAASTSFIPCLTKQAKHCKSVLALASSGICLGSWTRTQYLSTQIAPCEEFAVALGPEIPPRAGRSQSKRAVQYHHPRTSRPPWALKKVDKWI
jgi:hypothetical protein